MDGYAVVAARGRAAACSRRGSYLRIDTGQPVDDRFDAVAQVEIARESAEGLAGRAATSQPGRTSAPPARTCARAMRCCRRAACSRATTSRWRPSPATPQLPVTRRPAVAILPTGGELRPPGTALLPGEVADADGPMLQALARDAGATSERLPARPDDAARSALPWSGRRDQRPRAGDRRFLARPRRSHRRGARAPRRARRAWRRAAARASRGARRGGGDARDRHPRLSGRGRDGVRALRAAAARAAAGRASRGRAARYACA